MSRKDIVWAVRDAAAGFRVRADELEATQHAYGEAPPLREKANRLEQAAAQIESDGRELQRLEAELRRLKRRMPNRKGVRVVSPHRARLVEDQVALAKRLRKADRGGTTE